MFTAMKNRYPLLNKLPVLYPFSLVYRFIYGLTHKRKLITNAQKFKKIKKENSEKTIP
mgnify:CR=1 FL=1